MSQTPNLTRIGVSELFELPPHSFACGNLAFNRSDECRMPGHDADFIDYFFKLMKRPYKLVNCGRVFGMIYLNGTATDCMASLLNGTIDMIGGTFFPTAARRHYFSMSMPVHLQSFTVMAPTKVETFFIDHLIKLLTPFTMELWIMFFMCFCSVMIVRFVNHSWFQRDDCADIPSNFILLRGFSFRNLVTSWAITSMICISLYRCFLLSTMMMNTSPSTPIHDYKSLVDMIRSKQAVLYVPEIYVIIGEQIMREESLYELRDALVDNPIVMTNYFDKSIKGVDGHMAVMILGTGVAEYTARRSCNVTMFKIDLQHSNEATTLSLLFSKNISFLPEMNSLIQNKPSAISHMTSYYTTTDRDEICRASHTLSTPKYMSTETFVSATVFLLVGGVMGASVLIAEWFICRHLNKT